MQDRLQWAVLGGLLTVSVIGALTLREIAVLGAGFHAIPTPEPAMQTLTEVVTVISDPTRKITVTSTRLDGESSDAFVARHNALVTAAKGA